MSAEDKKKKIEKYKKYEDVVAACNRCGFCTSYCPTYVASGNEAYSPRGRNQAFRALLEGKLTDPEKTKDIVDTCLLCGECTSVCFSEVPTAQLMIQARDLINTTEGIPWGLRFIIEKVLTRPKLLYWLVKIMFLGKWLGISKLLNQIGLLKRISPTMANADRLVEDPPLRLLRDLHTVKPHLEETYRNRDHDFMAAQHKMNKLKEKGKEIPGAIIERLSNRPTRPKVAVMPVCGSQYLRPSITDATLKLLRWMGQDAIVPEVMCCGLPAASYGMIDHVKDMAIKNITKFERENFESIIADDSSCTAHIKEYPKYLKSHQGVYEKSVKISQRFRELSTFLLQHGMPDLLRKYPWQGGPVAYHDPCKAQYGQKITDPPRALLKSIPGVQLVPVGEADQCCGGGGTYSFVHPDLSEPVLERKIQHIIQSGCRFVVTSSASCLIQLQFGLRKERSKIEALHLSEFLLRAIERQR